jgi:hypothetical protein
MQLRSAAHRRLRSLSVAYHLSSTLGTESHSDPLVVATEVLVDDVTKHSIVRFGGTAILQPAGPELPGEHDVELGAVQADLGQQQQKSHQSDDDAELPVGCRR